jgi:ferredoxin/flavodoxin---NADP+ reductase
MKRGNSLVDVKTHRLVNIKHLTDSAYILQMEKNNFKFIPGQYISIGKAGSIDKRDYSIYSSPSDEFLEVLIRVVPDGMVSKSLQKLKVGSELEVEGPFGFFQLKKDVPDNQSFLFIASGTGISPFHSMIKNWPELNYKLLHGVRFGKEAYEKEIYAKDRLVICSSRDGQGNYYGRVTDYLRENATSKNTLCYLCGNSDMINDAFDILESQGIPADQIHAEVYF